MSFYDYILKAGELFVQWVNRFIGKASPEPLTGQAFILSQLREIFIMFICGACMLFMFRIYNIFIKNMCSNAGKYRKYIYFMADILFCGILGVVTAEFWYASSFGRISLHELAAMLMGVILGKKVFNLKNSKATNTIMAIYVIILLLAYIVIKKTI